MPLSQLTIRYWYTWDDDGTRDPDVHHADLLR